MPSLNPAKRTKSQGPTWRTLRFRLAVWNAIVVIITALVTLIGLRQGVRWALVHELDQVLIDDAHEIVLSINSVHHGNLESLKTDLERMAQSHEHRGWYVKLVDDRGDQLWATQDARPRLPRPNIDEDATPVTFEGYRIVQMRAPHAIDGVAGIRVGATLDRINEDMARIDRWVLLAAAAVLLAAPIGGYWLASRAVHTLGEIITTAARLRPNHLEERLIIRGSGDELDQLAETINSLLDRIAAYLNVKRDFLANAAHELRTPLAAIRSSVEVALNGARSPEEYEDLMVDVIEECGALEALVNQLLLLSETEAELPVAQFQRVDLNDLTFKAVDMFSGVAEARGVKLRVGRVDYALVEGNRNHLRQVLNNLLDNAVKYTPAGGEVTVEAIVDGTSVRLSIADTGTGISNEEQQHIFQRFFRAESARTRSPGVGGTGLGLSICQSVVHNHGGEIAFNSVIDRGTTFTVTLPLADSATTEESPFQGSGMTRVVSILFGLSAILINVAPLQAAEPAGVARPNIVLIYADDLGYGDVSINGGKIPTPNIDKLAQQGLAFRDAHSSAPTCTPSRFALLTGQYAFRQEGTGILPGDANLIIKPGTPTIASLLQSVGYKTGVIGKWHLGLGEGKVNWNEPIKPSPEQIGFDEHFIIAATGDRVPCVYVSGGRVVDLDPADPIEVSYAERIDLSPSGAEQPEKLKQRWSHGHDQSIVNGISRIGWMTGGEQARWIDEEMADVIAGQGVDFIERHHAEPFFLFFATQDIHVPRVPHSRFAGKSGHGLRGDAIMQLDWTVGQVLDSLEKHNLADNTLVIFSSDNGPVLDDGYVDQANELLGEHDPNGPYRAGKYSAFEGGTRVPFFVRWPARVPAGGTTGALFGQVDLAATLSALAGAKIPTGACQDSRDELDALLGEDKTGRPHLVHEGRDPHSLRMGPWKFVPAGPSRDSLNPGPPTKVAKKGALYNLSAEFDETTNLVNKHPEQAATMRKKLRAIATSPDRS
ncbi:sulfatase-like hydrolase/transferase [Lacipirellula parvula]|uniref:histidine kinase n=1 Tax=Lacipirellula parvula TaxID=2650471 RepID=A0A5K7XMH7_9BACT|nr:sulfatase-like hydrolase/transferase [Lacipirellula parvula]BBO35813.1 arylsulfatase [Lacipirellula parvula]